MFLFDIALIVVVSVGFYYGYKNGMNERLYDMIKVFVGFSVAESYSVKLGVYLAKAGVISADTFPILKLIGFLLAFVLFWIGLILAEYLLNIVFSNTKEKAALYGGAISTAAQFAIVFSLLAFFTTQVKPFKKSVKPLLLKSYSYKAIDGFYRKNINRSFVDSVVKGDVAGANSKEILFQSFAR